MAEGSGGEQLLNLWQSRKQGIASGQEEENTLPSVSLSKLPPPVSPHLQRAPGTLLLSME